MTHAIHAKSKLLNRVRRIRGQVEALERALEQEAECGDILRLIAAGRGAMNSLMAEVLEGHVRAHVFPKASPGSGQADAAEDLIEVVRAYLK